MKYVEAVENYDLCDLEKSLFLAGGITGCSNWQKEMVEMLKDVDLTVYNPRRENFPIDDPNAAEEQIAWEHRYLNRCKLRSFWFAKETIQPIALFELGRWSSKRDLNKIDKLFVGVDPNYPRRIDVEVQMKLENPHLKIVYTIEDLVAQIKESIK